MDHPAAEEPAEVVDALPVVAEPEGSRGRVHRLEPATSGHVVAARSLPVAKAAAMAVGSFAAGVAAAAVVSHTKAKRAPARSPRRSPGRPGGLPIVASRSFVVDVHLLGDRS